MLMKNYSEYNIHIILYSRSQILHKNGFAAISWIGSQNRHDNKPRVLNYNNIDKLILICVKCKNILFVDLNVRQTV